ncbi:MAG: hypothetical protein ACE5JA_05810 [bacterium]
MNRRNPVLSTYELEQIANAVSRIAQASPKDIDYTEDYIRENWGGRDCAWLVSFFAKLVEHAPSLTS